MAVKRRGREEGREGGGGKGGEEGWRRINTFSRVLHSPARSLILTRRSGRKRGGGGVDKNSGQTISSSRKLSELLTPRGHIDVHIDGCNRGSENGGTSKESVLQWFLLDRRTKRNSLARKVPVIRNWFRSVLPAREPVFPWNNLNIMPSYRLFSSARLLHFISAIFFVLFWTIGRKREGKRRMDGQGKIYTDTDKRDYLGPSVAVKIMKEFSFRFKVWVLKGNIRKSFSKESVRREEKHLCLQSNQEMFATYIHTSTYARART